MTRWIATHGWMLWALVTVPALVVYRLRKRGGDESLLRRIEYALIPNADPANRNRREMRPGMLVLVAGGLAVILLFLLIVAIAGR